MVDYYLISCQQINHRGGGFLVDIRFRGDGYLLRRQEREDVVDWELFYRLRLDERQPFQSRAIPAKRLEAIITELQKAAIPPLPQAGGGFDGTDFTLAINAGLNRAVYSWWLDVPAGWEPVATAWNALVALTEE